MAVSGALHFCCDYVPGYGLSDNRSLSNSVVSRRTLAVLPCSSCLGHKLHTKNERLKCTPVKKSLVCRASSGGHRRNPDFSRQNKHGFRGRNRQNEERDGFDGLEDSEMLSSKNGPVLSLSSSPKFQATSSPGPREREIVELFRKVQAQLRARAAAKKEGKKVEEASRGQGKESETVDSLLKLLRKHSGEQSKKKVSSLNSQEVNSDQLDRDVAYNKDQSPNLVHSRNNSHNTTAFTRPASSFRRKSPVPRYKSQPAYISEGTFDHSTSYSETWTQKKDDPVELQNELDDHEPEFEAEPEYEEPEPGTEPVMLEPESELKPESFYREEDDESELKPESFYQEEDDESDLKPESFYQEEDDVSHSVGSEERLDNELLDADEANEHEEPEQEATKGEAFGALKLTELRALAKSQGVKGFSKMKKAELVELLSSSDSR